METFRTCFCLNRTYPAICSHSTRRQHEIEVRSVCQWLCVAGFPQYVQIFQGNGGPINLSQVEKDHQFLDSLSLKLLLSQITFLNQLTSQKRTVRLSKEELSVGSDDEDSQAISDQWTCRVDDGRQWVHKFLPQSKIASGHRRLSCSSSYDSALANSRKMTSVIPFSRCSSSGPVSTGVVKARSSSLNGKAAKRSSFLSRDRSRTPLSRGSSVSDSEPSSEGSPISVSWSGGERSKLRSSFRNLFRRSENQRSRKGTSSRPPNAPSSGKLDISGPVFISTPEIEDKMDKLHCVDINSASIQALTAEIIESDVPVVATNNGNSSPSCDNICRNNGLVNNVNHCAAIDNAQDVSNFINNSFDDVAERKSSFVKNFKSSDSSTDNVVGNKTTNDSCLFAMNSDAFVNGKKVKDCSKDDRLSIYDNLEPSFDDSCLSDPLDPPDPQLELDLILDELYRNIESLNETLQEVGNNYSDDSNSVFEEISPSSINNKPLLSPQCIHISQLAIPLSNGALVTSDNHSNSKNDSKSGLTHNLWHVNDKTAGQNLEKLNEDIPGALRDWNEAKNPASVIPESMNCIRNSNDDSIERMKDDPSNSNGDSVRLETYQHSLRWDSFSWDHQPSFKAGCGNLSCMTACQLTRLRKLNLIRLSSILEKYVPSVPLSWFWSKSKPVNKHLQYSGAFGRPLLVNLQEMGSPLPTWIIYALQRIRRSAAEAIGIFRKSGVRSRIQQFRNQIQSDPDSMNFDSLQIYDVADLLKLYFRELPDCLLTRPLSQIFISIFKNVPKDLWLEGIRSGIALMPDENREVLQCLLFLLMDLSEFSSKNQMTASNLAICFAPSLFHVYGARETSPKLSTNYNKPCGGKAGKNSGEVGSSVNVTDGNKKLTPPVSHQELHEQQAAQECLTFLISNAKELFSVTSDILDQCNTLQLDHLTFVHPYDKSSVEIYRTRLQQLIADIIQESSENFKSWSSMDCINRVELSYKKLEHPLRSWMCCVEVSGSPIDVLTRIRKERRLWEADLIEECTVDCLGKNMDVYRYAFSRMPPQVPRAFCVLRLWDTTLPNGACILVSASVRLPENSAHDSIDGTVFASSYLIKPRGKEKSQVIYISQVDLRGYSPRWYRRTYGYLCINLMAKLRDSLDAHRQTNV